MIIIIIINYVLIIYYKVSLAFGLAVMAIACFTGHISGGEIMAVNSKHISSICVHQETLILPSPLDSLLGVNSPSSSAVSTLWSSVSGPLLVKLSTLYSHFRI